MPSTLVARFFQLVESRQFAEAERELERIKQKMKNNEWNKGYLQALNGILLSKRANEDNYSLLSRPEFRDRKVLREYRKEFLNQVNNRLRDDYDRGFFSAWADYARVLLRIYKEDAAKKKTNEAEASVRLKTKNGQVSIERFVSSSSKNHNIE